MNTIMTLRAASAAALTLIATHSAMAAIGDSASFDFNLPATALASQTPPYPSVATITLTEAADGVVFTLSPNWAGPGFSASSFIERLDFVHAGPAPTFTQVSGAPIASFSYATNPNNVDAGYKADDQHIVIDWNTGKNDDRFEAAETSSWKISGVLSDFTGTAATSGPKPSPIFGVISVTAYSLEGFKPTPSNWVAGIQAAPVPEASTHAMLALGLLAIGAFVRRRRQD